MWLVFRRKLTSGSGVYQRISVVGTLYPDTPSNYPHLILANFLWCICTSHSQTRTKRPNNGVPLPPDTLPPCPAKRYPSPSTPPLRSALMALADLHQQFLISPFFSLHDDSMKVGASPARIVLPVEPSKQAPESLTPVPRF